MITQTITASMIQTSLSKILTRRYDVGREIKFILYKDELLSDPIDLTDYTVVITVIKPDNNFVIENFSGDTVTITEQMEVVTGTGYYCVHVTKDNETIYTGQGEFIIDDVLISDDELESISEVNGLKFPDDFITVEDHVAVIDDTVTTTEKTWSSSKISDEIENVSVVVSKTAEGNPIELTDAADAPLVKCVTAITGYQSGTGTPSPDNVRPITAYTEGKVVERGRNLFNPNDPDFKAGYAINSATGNVYQVSSGNWNTSGYIPVEANTAYRLSTGVSQSSDVVWFDENKQYISGYTSMTTRTAPSNARYFRFDYHVSATQVMLTKGIEVYEYEPYTSTAHTTTFPSAIYRGSEDCVNGEVTEDYAKITVTSSNAINRSNDHQFYWNGLANGKPGGQVICDKLPYGMSSNTDCIFINSQGALRINTSQAFATAGDLKAWLMPIEIAYELATPTTSSVTPTNLPIKSISGYNHIESSTGDMDIEYITQDYQPLVESIVMESESRITKLWDAGFTPSPGVWLEYDFGEDLENYDALVIDLVVSGWEGDYSDTVTIYPKLQHLNTKTCYHYITGDYGTNIFHVSGTIYGLGAITGNYPPQYKAIYGIKY